LTQRTQERDWPTLPIPFFAFREIYEELARLDWNHRGALPPFEFTDEALILSALASPFASAGGEPAFPSVPAKAAALFRGLVKNHGLRDGNKRLAVTVLSTFLLANGWIPTYTNQQLYRYALRVARHKGNYDLRLIQRWIRRHCRLMSDGDLDILRAQNRRILRRDALVQAFQRELMPAGALHGQL
jgi:death-on-curing protein